MVAEWVTASAMLAVLGMTLGLWRWMVGVVRDMKDAQLKVDVALRGYEGQGGLLHDVEVLKGDCATVDERIKLSRHDARGVIQNEVMRLETGIHDHFEQFRRHIDQRFHDLGIGRKGPL